MKEAFAYFCQSHGVVSVFSLPVWGGENAVGVDIPLVGGYRHEELPLEDQTANWKDLKFDFVIETSELFCFCYFFILYQVDHFCESYSSVNKTIQWLKGSQS